MAYLWVAVGAALGGMARFGISSAMHRLGAGFFPWATLTVNVSGSMLIGWLAAHDQVLSPQSRLFLMTGLCGGYTTFSTFSLESLRMLEEGYFWPAAGNAVLSVLLCLGGAWIGQHLGRQQ